MSNFSQIVKYFWDSDGFVVADEIEAYAKEHNYYIQTMTQSVGSNYHHVIVVFQKHVEF